MTQLLKLKYLSPNEYLIQESQANIRHEYVDGEIFAMAGASERHNKIALNIAFQLRAATRGTNCSIFMSDMKIRVQQGKRFYYPDVSMCCDLKDNDPYFKDQPCLIAEVLSKSTATTDRREKWLAYRNISSLRYYLLVNSNQPKIDYFHRINNEIWELGQLTSSQESLAINCASQQAKLHFADIFEDIVWGTVNCM